MARRSQSDVEVPDENTPGGGVSPEPDATSDAPSTSDVAPSASEDQKAYDAGEVVKQLLLETEGEVRDDRTRQTLTGALLVAKAIIFGALLISDAIENLRNSPS